MPAVGNGPVLWQRVLGSLGARRAGLVWPDGMSVSARDDVVEEGQALCAFLTPGRVAEVRLRQ